MKLFILPAAALLMANCANATIRGAMQTTDDVSEYIYIDIVYYCIVS